MSSSQSSVEILNEMATRVAAATFPIDEFELPPMQQQVLSEEEIQDEIDKIEESKWKRCYEICKITRKAIRDENKRKLARSALLSRKLETVEWKAKTAQADWRRRREYALECATSRIWNSKERFEREQQEQQYIVMKRAMRKCQQEGCVIDGGLE